MINLSLVSRRYELHGEIMGALGVGSDTHEIFLGRASSRLYRNYGILVHFSCEVEGRTQARYDAMVWRSSKKWFFSAANNVSPHE